MKAEDLMVGDYVFWDWVTHKVDFDGDVMTDRGYKVSRRIIKVSSVNEAGVTFKSLKDGSRIYVKEEDLAPIPLTTEILEKNGWKKQIWWRYKQSDVVTYDISEELFPIELSGNEFWLVDNCSDDGDYGYESNWIVEVKYVHELQHALKLWGIEKEIVL